VTSDMFTMLWRCHYHLSPEQVYLPKPNSAPSWTVTPHSVSHPPATTIHFVSLWIWRVGVHNIFKVHLCLACVRISSLFKKVSLIQYNLHIVIKPFERYSAIHWSLTNECSCVFTTTIKQDIRTPKKFPGVPLWWIPYPITSPWQPLIWFLCLPFTTSRIPHKI
jgi:hypothetical protein